MASNVTVCDNKMYIRITTNAFDYIIYNNINNLLNKDILEKYYDGINKIINLANEILKNINE